MEVKPATLRFGNITRCKSVVSVMRSIDRKLCFIEDWSRVWKVYISGIIHEENEWNHNVEVDAVVVPVDSIWRDYVGQDIKEMKIAQALVPFYVSLELITTPGDV